MRARLGPDGLSAAARLAHELERAGRGEVDEVDRRFREAREREGPCDALLFDERRARPANARTSVRPAAIASSTSASIAPLDSQCTWTSTPSRGASRRVS